MVNDNILTAKQALMLTEQRDKTILLLSEAIADAAIAGKYSIQLYHHPENNAQTELEKLYWENEQYFSSYLRGIGYQVKWMGMTYNEVSWGEKKEEL